MSESRHGVISVEQQVANFIPDNSLPSLVAFTLDVNTGVLTMSFTEAVEQSSFNVSEIKLQSDTILTDSLDLTGGNISTSQANRIFIITLTATDLNSLKEKLNLATNINNTYISFTDRLAKDFNGLPIVEIDPEDAVRAADHAIDLTAPTLSAFTFDADTGTLVITFSETVSGSTLLVNRFILQSDPLSFTGVSYQLQAGSHSTAESRVVSIIVSSQDLNKIKELEMLATSQANTYLRNNMGAVEDTTGVTIAALADGSAIQASNYTQDDTPPELNDFYLDLDGAPKLVLTFSETINTTSLNTTGITLQSSGDESPVFSLTLGGGTVVNTTGPVVELALVEQDSNAIKLNSSIGTSSLDTFLVIANNSVQDMNGNELIGSISADAISAMSVVSDTTDPMLSSFSIDLDAGTFVLTFNEVVRANSFKFDQFTILRTSGTTLNSLTLTGL